jgi:hypothetical protein
MYGLNKNWVESLSWTHYATAFLAIEVGVINEWLKAFATVIASVLAIYTIIYKHMEIVKMRDKFYKNNKK